MGKHSDKNASGTDAQKAQRQKEAEARELKQLEEKLRKQGKIK